MGDGTLLTRDAYIKLVEEDIERLRKEMPESLERHHIEAVLNWSVDALYPPKEP